MFSLEELWYHKNLMSVLTDLKERALRSVSLNLQVDLERIVRAPLKGSDHALLQAVALGLCHDVRCPLARPVFNDVCDRAIGFGDPVRRKGDRMRSVRTLP